MNLEAALKTELEAISALTGKVYPLTTPGVDAPYAQYQSSYGVKDKALGGYLESKSVEASINLFAKTYSELKQIENAVVELLIGFEMRTIGDSGPFIKELTYEEPLETYEPDPKLYRCMIQFNIHL